MKNGWVNEKDFKKGTKFKWVKEAEKSFVYGRKIKGRKKSYLEEKIQQARSKYFSYKKKKHIHGMKKWKKIWNNLKKEAERRYKEKR